MRNPLRMASIMGIIAGMGAMGGIGMGGLRKARQAKSKHKITQQDIDALAAADAKRQRKNLKRSKK